MDGARPSAGWYPDPERPGWLRWWDGERWGNYWSAAPSARAQHAPPTPTTPAASTSTPRTQRPDVGRPMSTTSGRTMSGSSVRSAPSPARRAIVPIVLTVLALVVVAGAVLGLIMSGSTADTFTPAARAGESGNEGREAAPTRGDQLIDRCGVPDPPSIPGVDITVEPMTLDQEIDVGAATRDLILDTHALADDRATESFVDSLLDEMRPDDSPIPFTVTLLDDEEVSAFAIAGGDMFFTTGIVELLDEDELAFVMGHEIAHVQCRHLARRFEREALVAAGLGALFDSDIDADDLYSDPTSALLTNLASLPFSRADESESDLAALDLLERAGRPLSAGPDALEALKHLESHEPTRLETLLSTHPPTQQRIDDLEAAIANR